MRYKSRLWYQEYGGVGLRLQLGDLDAAVHINGMVAISPSGIEKLRALDHNLREMDTLAGGYLLGEHMDAGTQAKDQPCVFPLEDNVATPKEHLAGGRHDDSTILLSHVYFQCRMLIVVGLK